jgi:hypothetical protein
MLAITAKDRSGTRHDRVDERADYEGAEAKQHVEPGYEPASVRSRLFRLCNAG